MFKKPRLHGPPSPRRTNSERVSTRTAKPSGAQLIDTWSSQQTQVIYGNNSPCMACTYRKGPEEVLPRLCGLELAVLVQRNERRARLCRDRSQVYRITDKEWAPTKQLIHCHSCSTRHAVGRTLTGGTNSATWYGAAPGAMVTCSTPCRLSHGERNAVRGQDCQRKCVPRHNYQPALGVGRPQRKGRRSRRTAPATHPSDTPASRRH